MAYKDKMTIPEALLNSVLASIGTTCIMTSIFNYDENPSLYSVLFVTGCVLLICGVLFACKIHKRIKAEANG